MAETIRYRALQDCDVEQVRDILHKVFFSHQDGDPTSQLLKHENPRETRCFVEAIIPGVIEDGVSVVAVKEGPGEVLGIGLSHYITRENPRTIVFPRDDPDTRKMCLLMDIMDHTENGVDIFEKFNVSTYVHFHILAVKPENWGLGIATKLVEKAFELFKAKGANVVVVITTSLYTKKIFDKLGFETIHEIRYHDYIMDGERLCTESGINGHKLCSFCAKRL